MFAHVTPSRDVPAGRPARRLPLEPAAAESSSVTAVKQVYDRMRAVESRPGSTPAAVEAGWQALREELGGRTYDEFV